MADAKLTALTALAQPSLDDLVYVVDDPAGTPVGKKTTAAAIFGLNQGFITGMLVTKNAAAQTIDVSAGYFYDPSSTKVISYAGATGIAVGTLNTVSNQHNQVYAYDNAGTTTIEVSVNSAPPSTTYFGKARQGGTNSNRRWIGGFLSNAAAAGALIVPQDVREVADGQISVIYLSAANTAPFRVLSAGSAAAFTAQTLVGCIPRYVAAEFNASLLLNFATTGGDDVTGSLSSDGTNTTSGARSYVFGTGGFPFTTIWHLLESATPQVYYKVAGGAVGVGPRLYIDVAGYRAAR